MAVTCDGGTPFSARDGGCVEIDPSSYDRSCVSDSDCMAISAGMVCSSGCRGDCPTAAINVRERACYEQAIPQPRDNACECGSILAPDARCINGVCTYCGHAGDCP